MPTDDGGTTPAHGPLTRPVHTPDRWWLRFGYAGICLYLFLCAINVMGSGLKILGNNTDWVHKLLSAGGNPVLALMGGTVATALVQSSSFTTALIITFVAAGQMELETAIFAIMGANIGTSITNNIVSITTWRIRRQFRRAYSAAMMHGLVNLFTVSLLFPLEWISQRWFANGHGVLTNFSMWVASLMGRPDIEKPNSPIKMLTKPVVELIKWLADVVFTSEVTQGIVVAAIGLIILFTALVFLVSNLKGALLRRIEGLFSSFLFRTDSISGVVGFLSTIAVQSSSVTTSLIVPLVGAGAVRVRRAFPFMLGCNLGTTITGVLAAMANPVADAVGVAVCHVTFNVTAAVIWYPLRAVPIGLATWYARLASRSKRYYVLFLVLVYFVTPSVIYAISLVVLRDG